jgi:hypothetical protein
VISALLVLPGSGVAAEHCPYKPNAVPIKAGDVIACTCNGGIYPQAIYGTDRYTADSDTCTAAVHAGAITTGGGNVTLHIAEGCKEYTSTDRQGIVSHRYGSYPLSVAFIAPLPPCADVGLEQARAARLRTECAKSGGSEVHCACMVAGILKEMPPDLIDFLHAMNDALTTETRARVLVTRLNLTMQKVGYAASQLPTLRDIIADGMDKMEPCPP